ncbi:nicotinate (nicotinamide) nucleotide adenylyltransferase [PVC group bacterium (ex Bugula neritina AB1)]|nr:nicotinate (nicotinamide) nucleotide adenylyltransferase [PVC group bacterium (ex Bugula neritina AB1)]
MNKKKRFGILGGTFDPFHFGHWRMAEESVSQMNLDKVFFVPAFVSPHKSAQAEASGDLRLELLKEVVQENDKWECSDWEIRKLSKSYSIDTVKFFCEKYPFADFFWIMGYDQWEQFYKWKAWRDILKHVGLIVCSREGYENVYDPSKVGLDKVHWLKNVKEKIASSELRADLAKGRSIEKKVPRFVMTWIKENRLYGYTNNDR